MTANEWKTKGQFQKIHDHQIFYVDTKPHTSNNTLTILHGYPSMSFDYHHTLPILSKNRRVVAHDHLGFGFSDKPLRYSYSLIEQADYALALWQKLGIQETILFAHDYGTSVATEIIARKNFGYEPVKIKALILCNGSVHIEFSQLRLIQKLLRSKLVGKYVGQLTSEKIFIKNMSNIWYDKNKVDRTELKEMWKMLTYNDGKKVIHQLTQYITERFHFWDRWIGNLRRLDIPVLILWGKNDPVAVPKIAEALAEDMPHAELVWMEKTGHYPMIERPQVWAAHLLNFIKKYS